jgi:Derlin-2/3
MFLAPSLSFMVVYVWSRRNPHGVLSLFGMFQFTAPYLPWVLLVIGLLLEQSPVYDILGILVGHIYFFWEDVYPQFRPGRRLLKTPRIMYVISRVSERIFLWDTNPILF